MQNTRTVVCVDLLSSKIGARLIHLIRTGLDKKKHEHDAINTHNTE